MANFKISELTENTSRHFNDLAVMVDDPAGTPLTQNMKFLNLTGLIVNAQTGTSYTYLTGDYGKLVTHTNGSAIAGTLPQASATFPANWFMYVQNRGAGALTITPTTSTIDGAATLVLNQNEGALVVSDGTNYFSMRGKATGGVGGVGDVVGPASATDHAIARFDTTTGKLIQDSVVIISDAGAITVPEIAAPSTPAAGTVHIYAKSDGKLYIKDDAGTETDLTAAGGGSIAPLVIESADEVAQRNGTTGQSFYVYKSFTDANNWSRLKIAVSSTNDFQVTFQALSAGSPTNPPGHLQWRWGASRYVGFDGTTFYPDANATIDLGTGSARWNLIRAVNLMVQTGLLFESGTQITDAGASFGGVVKFSSSITGPGTFTGGSGSPSLGSSNLNNFDPATISHFQRWTSGAAIDVTGMTRFQQDGQVHVIVNVGSNNITLKHENASSTAANRFLCDGATDIVLAANEAADVIYDTTTQRWRAWKKGIGTL